MPFFAICVQAVFENIKELRPAPDRTWGVLFACSSCREQMPNHIEVDPEGAEEKDGGTYNCLFSCKFCKKKITVSVAKGSEGSYTGEGGPAPVIVLDCRGGEPVDLYKDDQWIAVSEDTDHEFVEGVDLSQDWADYDEKADADKASVMISEVAFSVQPVRGK